MPLTLDDLNEDDLESLAGGSFQLLPGKDMAGRSVAFIARKFATFKDWRAGVSSNVVVCENIQWQHVVNIRIY